PTRASRPRSPPPRDAMIQKLEQVERHYEELAQTLAQPDTARDRKRFAALSKEYKDLTPLVEAFRDYRRVLGEVEGAKAMLAHEKDEDLRAMARDELAGLTTRQAALEDRLKVLLLPK